MPQQQPLIEIANSIIEEKEPMIINMTLDELQKSSNPIAQNFYDNLKPFLAQMEKQNPQTTVQDLQIKVLEIRDKMVTQNQANHQEQSREKEQEKDIIQPQNIAEGLTKSQQVQQHSRDIGDNSSKQQQSNRGLSL